MRFVLDASIVVTWAMRDEAHPLADRAFAEIQKGSAIAPAILWYEIRNILVLNERRGRIAQADSSQFITHLEEYEIAVDFPQDSDTCVALARRHSLSVYDAAYLALAMRERAPLATLDRQLTAAASVEGVPILS